MRVLVVGGGGREHCLAWKIATSPKVEEVVVAPGNAGTAHLGRNVDISAEDIEGLVGLAKGEGIDLVVVGPEVPLTLGIADRLADEGIPCFGPSKAASQLEGSKAFCKKIIHDSGIPTAECGIFEDYEEATAFLSEQFNSGKSMVIKADGLAAGKGVFVPDTLEEAQEDLNSVMVEKTLGNAGNCVVIEEKLVGEEVSVIAFCDGDTVVPLLSSQDHKRIGEGDTGPNTGGMGAYAPVPKFGDDFLAEILETVLKPTAQTMKDRGTPYKGILYAGIMVCDGTPYVLEYNVRLGDPETEAILPLMKSDIIEPMMACIEGTLTPDLVEWHPRSAMTVVAASGGYPGKYEKGKVITGLSDISVADGAVIFHAGTTLNGDDIVTSGGRVLNIVGVGENLEEAAENAYCAIEKISFDGIYYRKDIGWRTLA